MKRVQFTHPAKVLHLIICLVAATLIILSPSACAGQNKIDWKNISVLLYTKNGKGYVHENIPHAIVGIKKIGEKYGFNVEASEDPSVFTPDNLKKYTLIIFASTNNDVFDSDDQRLAFRQYIEAGGGFVGIHSVVGTERNWKWFKTLLGGTFVWHPKFQPYRLVVVDRDHPSVKETPHVWEKLDECYFVKEMYPGIHTIIAHDLTSLNKADSTKIAANAGPFTTLYPAVWHHQFDGGFIWITALGHAKTDYEDPTFVQHIFNGISFIASQVKNQPDFKRSYARSKDEPVR